MYITLPKFNIDTQNDVMFEAVAMHFPSVHHFGYPFVKIWCVYIYWQNGPNFGVGTLRPVVAPLSLSEQWPVDIDYLLYIGDEILPSYMGIISWAILSTPMNQPVQWNVTPGFWALLKCFLDVGASNYVDGMKGLIPIPRFLHLRDLILDIGTLHQIYLHILGYLDFYNLQLDTHT